MNEESVDMGGARYKDLSKLFLELIAICKVHFEQDKCFININPGPVLIMCLWEEGKGGFCGANTLTIIRLKLYYVSKCAKNFDHDAAYALPLPQS